MTLRQSAERLARRAVGLEPLPQPPLVRTRLPVVLMHGFGALAAPFGRGPLHGLAMHLRGHGVLAYAPHVNPYDTIEVRASAWAERIEHVLEESGAGAVSLVAFSAGGLDARHLLSARGHADRVAALVTVSTPHRGTGLGEILLGRPERQRALLLGFMEFFGRAAYAPAPPRAEAALRELTPAFVREQFNPAHADVGGVYYASWAGRAGRGTAVPISPSLRLHNRLLFEAEGINDGMVPVASARWGDFRGTVEADHARQIGAALTRGGFDAGAFFLGIARDLARRGF